MQKSPRLCIDCGADISQRPRMAKFCVDCVDKRKLEHDRKRNRSYKKVEICGQARPHCRGCVFVSRYGYCNYFAITGHTRTSQHMDDLEHLNDPCKEYKPKGKKNIVERRA